MQSVEWNAPRRIRTAPLGFPRGEAGRLDGSSEPARLTEEGRRQPRYCLHSVQWYQPKIIADSFTMWRTAFIKQAPFPIHRTLHETFGARHPSSVTPLTGRASFPPGEAKGPLRICPRFLKTAGAYRNPSAAAAAAQLCMKRLHPLNLSGAPRKGLFCFGLGKGATNILEVYE